MSYEDLAEPVYRAAEKFVSSAAVNGWQRSVNRFFTKHASPFVISASARTRVAKLTKKPEKI